MSAVSCLLQASTVRTVYSMCDVRYSICTCTSMCSSIRIRTNKVGARNWNSQQEQNDIAN